ncbi:mitochondrial carrier domain-containing protein [Chytridium lagenaria]|nr:mitochondrial carrier domain-containing protein [Chytridium lagenaria]
MVAVGDGRKTGAAGIAGAGVAGFLELFIFHPLDTASKRLMHHRGRNFPPGSNFSQAVMGLRKVIFKEAAGTGLKKELGSLYPAFGYAVMYKMLQRSLQFGLHPIVSERLSQQYGTSFRATFGDKWYRTMIAASGGILIGIAEVILLPLDALKVKGQTGVRMISKSTMPTSPFVPSQPSARSIHTLTSTAASLSSPSTISAVVSKTLTRNTVSSFSSATPPPQQQLAPSPLSEILRRPAILANLYRGASWTAARNSFGCFALFGASVFVKDRVFLLEDHRRATFLQTFLSSVAGACASIAVAAPLDVVKVRVQASPLDAPIKGWKVVQAMVRNEGVMAFTKGVVPKMLASGPKVTFSFTIAQTIANWFAAKAEGKSLR